MKNWREKSCSLPQPSLSWNTPFSHNTPCNPEIRNLFNMDSCWLTQVRKIQAHFVSKSLIMSTCCFALLGLEDILTEIRVMLRQRFQEKVHTTAPGRSRCSQEGTQNEAITREIRRLAKANCTNQADKQKKKKQQTNQICPVYVNWMWHREVILYKWLKLSKKESRHSLGPRTQKPVIL